MKTKSGIELIPPLSIPGVGRQYQEALPAATEELCGDKGVSIAVGFTVSYLVYRGTFDKKSNSGSWNYLYSGG